MNLILSIIYMANILLVQLPTHPQNDEIDHIVTIATYKEDITGNGSNEKVELKGMLLAKDQSFYRDIWLEIKTDDHRSWTISYLGGYEPEVHFITLSDKEGKSIFFTSKQSESKHHSKLHSIMNGKLFEEKLPNKEHMSGLLLDDYTVQLSIHDYLEPSVFQITDKEAYENFYYSNGELQKQVTLQTGNDISFTPILISTSKSNGLKSFQDVYNEETQKSIGAIETIWYFENDRWVKIKEQWIAS